ncbi:hypothetical protein ACA910_016453 [Epithemia clementina (nom. ined.)]
MGLVWRWSRTGYLNYGSWTSDQSCRIMVMTTCKIHRHPSDAAEDAFHFEEPPRPFVKGARCTLEDYK